MLSIFLFSYKNFTLAKFWIMRILLTKHFRHQAFFACLFAQHYLATNSSLSTIKSTNFSSRELLPQFNTTPLYILRYISFNFFSSNLLIVYRLHSLHIDDTHQSCNFLQTLYQLPTLI